MNIARRIAFRLFTIPTLLLVLSVGLFLVLKPLSEMLANGGHAALARPVLSWGILAMLAGYLMGGVWLAAAMWRFLSWARGDLNGDCPRCKGRLKTGAGGGRRCPLCGYRNQG